MTLATSILRQGKGWLTLIAACSMIGSGVTLALPALLGQAIDAMVTGTDGTRPVLLAAALITLAVLTGLVDSYAGTACVAGTTAWLRLGLMRHLLSLSPDRTRRFGTGDLVSRVSGNAVDAAQTGTSLVTVATAVVPPVGSLILLTVIDVWTALAFLAGVGLVAVVLRAFTRHTSAAALGYQRTQGTIAARLTEALDGIRTITAAGTTTQEGRRILADLPALRTHGRQMWRVLARSSAQAAVVGPVVLVAVLAVGGLALTHGRISPGELFAASRYAVLGAGLGGLTSVLGVYGRAKAAAQRIAEVMDQPVTSYGARALPGEPGQPGRLDFRAVSVAGALDDVNLTLPGGACVAVVGRSGSGKSALAELAARLRDPDSGAVLLDGVPLADLDHAELRDAVGCAFERPHLVGATVGDAVGLGRDPVVVDRAARAAQSHHFIVRLPHGYDTPLAQTPMSGGERQRLGLTRAWPASRLLVLDDATSGLDTITEMKIARTLFAADERRTRLVVTHRAVTAASADLVVWLDGGRLRGLAPHDTLWSEPDYRAALT